MPVHYGTIQTAAWLPPSADASIMAGYRALPFPEHWTEALLRLCNAGRGEDQEPYLTVPTRRIEQVMQALLPDVLILPRPRRRDSGLRNLWLLVPEHLDVPPDTAFRPLINAWAGELRPEPEHRSILRETRDALAADPPQWDPVQLELLRCPVSDGGTATPLDHQFPLLTDWIARRILELPPYEFDGGRLVFRAVPRGARDQGAELVSQPLPFEARNRTAWFSVVLNITVQTVPFDPLPRVHLHCGIRRWATRPHTGDGRVRIPYRSNATVLLRPHVPWLPGAPLSERFAVARLERRWDRDRKGYVTDWAHGGPTRILRDISLGAPFPNPDDILSEPERWLHPGMHAAITHSTAMGGHAVGPGLMSHQRSELAHWAADAFPTELRLAPALAHTQLASTTPANRSKSPAKDHLKRAEEVRVADERRACAALAVGRLRTDDPAPVLETRLLWQTPQLREVTVEALKSQLGLKGDGGAPAPDAYDDPVVLEWQMPELTVRLRVLKLTGGLARELPIADGARRTDAIVAAAVSARRAEAARFLRADGAGSVPTAALVELDRRRDFSTPDHDPKFALRLGFADAGVLTQFIAVPKKIKGYDSVTNAGHRAAKAWDDALRQLGARVHPEHSLAEGVPAGLRYAAVWLVRKNRTTRTRWAGHVPVAVRVTPERPGSGLAHIEGWDPEADGGAGAWIPYPEMLLRLTRLAELPREPSEPSEAQDFPGRKPWFREMEDQRRSTEEWLQKVTRSLRGMPTLLLVHAQNARSHWTWIQDGQIRMDRLRSGHAPPRRLDLDLRLVRVRTAADRETAQWWGVHPKDGPNGLPSHLWVTPGAKTRVFWSTTPKASQFKSSAVKADKLAPRSTGGDKPTIDTDKQAWNPRLVELAILGCHEADGDSPEAIATLVHQMRQPPGYPDALALPLPLHLANRAQEYVLPTLSEDEDTDNEADDGSVADEVTMLYGTRGTVPAVH